MFQFVTKSKTGNSAVCCVQRERQETKQNEKPEGKNLLNEK